MIELLICRWSRVVLHGILEWQVVINSLVVVVHSNAENFLSIFLTNHMLIQILIDLEKKKKATFTK